MNTFNSSLDRITGPLDQLQAELNRELTEVKSKTQADFTEAYPSIEQFITKGGTVRKALEKFNAIYGHKLYPPGFRKLLLSERSKRCEEGNVASCPSCGQLLRTAEVVPPNDSETGGEQ